MRLWKRPWVWVLGTALLFLGMLAGLFLTDEAPSADQDLRGFRRTVAEEDNGFYLIFLEPDAVVWPDNSEETDRLDSTSETFDRAAARAFIAEHEERLRRIPECLARPDFQVPEMDSFYASTGYLEAWSDLATVVRSRARLHVEEGEIVEALADGLLLVRFGHSIEGAQGVCFTAGIGQAIQVLGAESIIETTRRGGLPLADLKTFLTDIRRHERNLDGLKDSLRGQYCAIASHLDAVAAGSAAPDILATGLGLPPFLLRLLFKANQTKRLLAEEVRPVLEAVGRTASTGSEGDEDLPRPSLLGSLVSYPGKALVHQFHRALGGYLENEQPGLFRLRAAQVFLALRVFETATGKLPDSLAALVPEYLPAVPEDPFDGQPLRYDAAKRIVYSVGSDLVDAGGSAEETRAGALDDTSEPTLRL